MHNWGIVERERELTACKTNWIWKWTLKTEGKKGKA